MKKLILALTLLSIIAVSAYAYCQTEWNCVNDCTRRGYMWSFCKSACTWCQ